METEIIIEIIPLVLQGKATEKQEQLLYSWLKENEENQNDYREFCATYYKLQYAQQWSDIDLTKAVHQAKLKLDKKTGFLRISYWFSGVAAVFLICLSVLFLLRREEMVLPVQENVLAQVKSGERKAMLTLADGSQVELTKDYKVDMDLGTVRATEDSAVGLIYRGKDTTVLALEYHTLTVPRSGEYIMILSDGTRVWLNSESELKYPVLFGNGKREVFITGEAFFEVVKDSLHPFVVHTPHTQTTVLGTSFNVMAYRDEQQTEITLVRGAVTVQAGKQNQYIHPGQQIQVDNRSMEMSCREVDVTKYASWKSGLFDFEGMTLEELAMKLSRWYDMDFFFVNKSAGEKKFTGAIKRNNNLQFMLDFIEKTSNVRFEVQKNVVRVYNR